MLVRYAEFVGSVHPGREAEFYRFVNETLVPLWRAFEGVAEVTVSREDERDEGAPAMPLLLTMRYRDRAALERAMACDARFRSREETKRLLTMFDGVIYHRVCTSQSHGAV